MVVGKKIEADVGQFKCPNMSLHTGYKIPEILIKRFIELLKPMYNVLEGKHTSNSIPDTSLEAILVNYSSKEAFDAAEKTRLLQKAIEAAMGYFHQDLAGSFPGWKVMKNGTDTNSMDVVKEDGSEVMEVKNKHNTMNSGSIKSVKENLTKAHAEGKKAILAQIQCGDKKPPRHGLPPEIVVMNGQQMYEYLSGRPTFFNDLNETLAFTFKNFKAYEALLQGSA